MKRFYLAILIFPVWLTSSCAGVKVTMKADHIDAPVSFTPYVYNSEGKVVGPAGQKELKKFSIKKRSWAMLYRSVNLTHNDWDLSEELRKELSSVEGDAIVNMTVFAQGDGWWMLSSIAPIIPSYHVIVFEGQVVRLKEGPRSD